VAVISRGWKATVALFAMVGICAAQETNWTPAVRGAKLAASVETPAHPEVIARDIRNGLVLWVPANTSQTAAAWDYSTNSAPLDLTNSAAAQIPIWTNNAGGSWKFTMTNFWKTPDVANIFSTQCTVAIWANLTNGGSVAIPISKGLNTVGAPFAFGIRVTASNSVTIITGDGTTSSIDDSGFQMATNVWYHLTFSNSNGNRRLFIDGIQRLAVSNANWGHVGSTNIYVGSFFAEAGTQRFWNGFLDNPQIWTRALNSNEIFQLAWGPTNFGQRRAHNK
jgi:hypothetical protein